MIFPFKFIEHLLHGYPAVTRTEKEYRIFITRQPADERRSLLFCGKEFMMTTQRMPALFLGHGSPMNVLEDNTYTRAKDMLEAAGCKCVIVKTPKRKFYCGGVTRLHVTE